ncbi:MAG: hypothetical protein Q4Q53_06015, partial [Methanocorpusculum sp.]|nr:hypothetical protein [Methanocorpusculum sp.]
KNKNQSDANSVVSANAVAVSEWRRDEVESNEKRLRMAEHEVRDWREWRFLFLINHKKSINNNHIDSG